jgi:hypothetical protein
VNPSKQQHRLTPTQILRQEIVQLKADLADQVRADDDTVYERRFLIPGHADGSAAYLAVRRHGDAWAVIDNNSGHRAPSWWDGRLWWSLSLDWAVNTVYRFTRADAEQMARQFAAEAAERHHRNALLEQARRIEQHANEALKNLKVAS